MKGRKELLEDLVTMSLPVNEILAGLSNYPWDTEKVYFVVLNSHAINVLELVLNNKITVQVVEDWANAIESREDLDFESEELYQIIVELANPLLYSKLTDENIKNYLDRLR